MARYFSIEEVNDLLPKLNLLMGELLERRAKVTRMRPLLGNVIQDKHSNTGSAEASAVVQDFMRIERLAERIQGCGCEIKDWNGGMIDFLTRCNGREVYLCWRYGEPLQIEHYHDLRAGFAGRRTISEDDDFWTEDV